MAKTTQGVSTPINQNVKQIWEEKLFRESIVDSYFMPRFSGEGNDNIVQVKTDLAKTRGDRINFGLRFKLNGAGITSGQTLEGNEENLTDTTWTTTLEQYRHAVRDDGAMSRQRKMFDISAESRSALVDWGAEKIDDLIFDALDTDKDATGAIYLYQDAGVNKYSVTKATAEAAVEQTDKLNLDFISYIKSFAKTGRGRTFNPIKPIKVNGRSHYVLLVHPDALYDLRVDSQFQQAMREAQGRGNENPLFNGATAIWDNVVIHEHERVPTKVSGNGGWLVNGCEAYLLGAQSICYAWGQRPKLTSKMFDYDNEIGYAWSMISKADCPYFSWNSVNYRNGSLVIPMARTKISDIAAS